MTLVRLTHTDGNAAYVAPEHVAAVMPPKSATPSPGVMPNGGPGAIVYLSGGTQVLVLETVEDVRAKLDGGER
jgi:hypothetical protein